MKLILSQDINDGIKNTYGANDGFLCAYNEDSVINALKRLRFLKREHVEIIRTKMFVINPERQLIEDALVDAGFCDYKCTIRLYLISKDKTQETIIMCSRLILDIIGTDMLLIYQTDSPEENYIKVEKGSITVTEQQDLTDDTSVAFSYTVCGEMYEFTE